MIGLFGSIICGLQLAILERGEIKSIHWNVPVGNFQLEIQLEALLFVAFNICMFVLYSISPYMMIIVSATLYNLSLLSSDVYAIIVGSRPFQDPFAPRIQTRIINGTWDKECVLNSVKDPQSRHDREAALEVIAGCLDMDVQKRWTIRDVLCSRWLRDFADPMSEPESVWKL